MSLLIKLGDLYSSRRHRRTREVAKAHVWAHFVREQLKNRRVRIATVRPTGWHPENNAGGSGWHLTVDFRTRNKVHVTTHHIYYDAGSGWESLLRMAPSRDRSAGIQLPLEYYEFALYTLPFVLNLFCSFSASEKPEAGSPITSLVAVPFVASPPRYRYPPPTSPSLPFHHVTVAVMTGVARVALAECLGGGSDI
ncbi:hypothetical protein EDB85DRAFT_2149787 [Lactarius pseudohatsudake]|nr:hypothetical protein EDB85DRAFT_2149787 [Lactarius pseudohatsudake]